MVNIDIKPNEPDIIFNSFIELIKHILGNPVCDSVNLAIKVYLDEVNQCSIDYSGIRDNLIKSQLEEDHKMMLIARARNDFVEYCRFAYLQIEPTLQFFIEKYAKKYKQYLINNGKKHSKYSQYKYWYKFMNSENFNSKKYYCITNIMNIRDSASHRGFGCSDIRESLRRSVLKNSKAKKEHADKLIEFYDKRDFKLIKEETENFVIKTFTHFELCR